MTDRRMITIDGNEAVASVAYRTNEVIAIYPITPASPMGEFADAWSAQGKPNIWGDVPSVVEMQSEGGAAGTAHGALQAGSLTTTFTASQGLLLKIPNLYKIAGELTAFSMHVAARTLATHALSIFCDHSDVMACRQAGCALLCSGTVQEAHDFALIAQAATLESRIPFLHFFDGFRTSHEVAKIEELTDEDLLSMMDEDLIRAHRERALTPDRPVIRGTAQNPDTFFQAREACNNFYNQCPGILQKAMDQFAELTGRRYRLFDYHGHPEADRVLVLMGSGAEAAHETADWLNSHGEKVGVLRVRLYRPFSIEAFMQALPSTVEKLCILDRTKEPGAPGDPLYLDVVTALHETATTNGSRPQPQIVAGRYGLSSKEFNPACVKAIYDELAKDRPRNHFTIGIVDDVTHTSLPVERFDIEPPDRVRAVFFGLGADGTVSANKNSIKIIGEGTDNWAQGYFVYDSKKSGAMTISHLRFGKDEIRSTYLVQKATFLACHQFNFLERYEVLEYAAPGATFLLNSPYPADEVWDHLPREVQEILIEKKIDFWVIDGYEVARETGMGGRINTIMQTCFFALSGVLPKDEAIAKIKEAVQKTYGKKGQVLVEKNFAAVDAALDHLHQVEVPTAVTSDFGRPPLVSAEAPDFVQKVTSLMMANKGDLLPVSAFPPDGTWPTATTQWEKRDIALEIPIWDAGVCIQCNQCAMVCPHAAIRAKVYDETDLAGAPDSFRSVDYKAPDFKGMKYTIQVAPEDCTGCTLCVEVCPAKDKASPRRKAINMEEQRPVRDRERENYSFFLDIPELDRSRIQRFDTKSSQFLQPLFEYSGACAGCGETPYVKLLTQLYGDRLLIANATGCSSIYGGNLPTTPYAVDGDGRGPAWANSLFEDNAEFGLGFRMAVDSLSQQAHNLLGKLGSQLGDELVTAILEADQSTEAGISEQRKRVEILRGKLEPLTGMEPRRLTTVADYLVKKSVWILGGDGWAYDIGFGGLDHVLSLEKDVNILVMDTEVYSNTGGQASKATPMGAAAKFAFAGKSTPKKALGLEAMTFRNVYVGRIAFGANMNQTVQTLREAEAFPGTSMVVAYSPCIAHGYDLSKSVEQQKRLVGSGLWALYRYDPRRAAVGQPPLKLDSKAPKLKVKDFMDHEARFRMVEKIDPDRFRILQATSQKHAEQRWHLYEQLAGISVNKPETAEDAEIPTE
ncbi:MAG: pyruvate:ferredoxin (flavodoxin) oxidoreductase [Thermoanaerobaculia bacterium]